MWLQDFIKPKGESTEGWQDKDIQSLLKRYDEGEKTVTICKMLMMLYTLHGDETNTQRYGDEMLERIQSESTRRENYYRREYYHTMGRLNVFYQRWEAAIENYLKSLEEEKVTETYHELAGCYGYLKDLENAEKYGLLALEEALKDDGEPNYMWEDIGKLLAEKKKFKEAIDIFSEYAQYNPNEWYPIYCIGQCWQELGDQYRAMAFYQKTLSLDPDNPYVYNNYGALAINDEGRIQEGIGYFKHALEHIGNKTELKTTILINLGRAYSSIADYDQEMHYKAQLLQHLGFPVEIVEVDDDEEE